MFSCLTLHLKKHQWCFSENRGQLRTSRFPGPVSAPTRKFGSNFGSAVQPWAAMVDKGRFVGLLKAKFCETGKHQRGWRKRRWRDPSIVGKTFCCVGSYFPLDDWSENKAAMIGIFVGRVSWKMTKETLATRGCKLRTIPCGSKRRQCRWAQWPLKCQRQGI